MNLLLDDDAFGDAQIKSKLVLADAIERAFYKQQEPAHIDFYASWYGVAPFLLLSRQRLKVSWFRCWDIDPSAAEAAERLCRHWSISDNKFSSFTGDVNALHPTRGVVHMIVNTSLEHMEKNEWFDNIPSGMAVALQGTDMMHPNEVVPNPILSMEHLLARYPLRPLYDDVYWPKWSRAKIDFAYPDEAPFSRYMVIGRKT
jgi:hypothetical protein